MLMMVLTVLIVASVPVFGGRFARLADLRIRHAWVVAVALVVQVLIISVVPGVPHAVGAALHIGTYVAAGFVVWANRALPGLLVIGAGAGLNALAITVNGGELPASAGAMRAARVSDDVTHYVNSGPLAHPRLGFLGDVFATPSWLPLHNVFSVGDVLILVGAGILVHRTAGSRAVPRLPILRTQ